MVYSLQVLISGNLEKQKKMHSYEQRVLNRHIFLFQRSYGVVIWELCTYADTPYTGKDNDQVYKFVKNRGRLDVPPNSLNIL